MFRAGIVINLKWEFGRALNLSNIFLCIFLGPRDTGTNIEI